MHGYFLRFLCHGNYRGVAPWLFTLCQHPLLSSLPPLIPTTPPNFRETNNLTFISLKCQLFTLVLQMLDLSPQLLLHFRVDFVLDWFDTISLQIGNFVLHHLQLGLLRPEFDFKSFDPCLLLQYHWSYNKKTVMQTSIAQHQQTHSVKDAQTWVDHGQSSILTAKSNSPDEGSRDTGCMDR
mgnify:CR=1 FL=1